MNALLLILCFVGVAAVHAGAGEAVHAVGADPQGVLQAIHRLQKKQSESTHREGGGERR